MISAVNPAVWNPLASAGGGMRCNMREVALLYGSLRLLPEGAPLRFFDRVWRKYFEFVDKVKQIIYFFL